MSLPYNYDVGELYEKLWLDYGDQYTAVCKKAGYEPDMSDFVIWCEDNDLIPELIYDHE